MGTFFYTLERTCLGNPRTGREQHQSNISGKLMSHFSRIRALGAAGLLSLSAILSACGGGDSSAPVATRSSNAVVETSESVQDTSSPTPQFVALMEEGARLNAEELQAAQTSAAPSTEEAVSVGTPKAAASLVAIYRFFNTTTAAHFFTASIAERDSVRANLRWMKYEGIAFYASSSPARGLSPVYRFYNTRTGVHLYTISESEKTNVQTYLPEFRYEGIAYYASQVTAASTSGIRRFFVRDRGFHFYTSSPEEAARIRATLPNYVDEGPAYFALTDTWTRPADVDLTIGRWILTGRDTRGYSWDGTELIFLQQVASGDNFSVLARANIIIRGSLVGWANFSGTLYADGRLDMSAYEVQPGGALITADWKAVLDVSGTQFLNGSVDRADGRVIRASWTATR